MAKGEIKFATELISGLNQFHRTTCVGGNLHRKSAVVIVSETVEGQSGLPQITHALDSLGPCLALTEHGQEERSQNSDNRHDAEQFNQGERPEYPSGSNRIQPFRGDLGISHGIRSRFVDRPVCIRSAPKRVLATTCTEPSAKATFPWKTCRAL